MKWFEGSITEAVATSKSRKAIFVVFVEGNDDASVQVAQAIDATEVSCRLEQEDFVAIRLESGSETYRFFAQIYQLVPIPSMFFIGENGAPLEIIAGSTTTQELITKIDSALVKAGKTSASSSLNLINAEQKAAASSSSSSSDHGNTTNVNITSDSTPKASTEETEKSSTDKLPDDNSTTKKDTKEENPAALQTEEPNAENEAREGSATPELTAEEKLDRAKQLIEIQRKQRIEEEEKKERERELERRRLGRDVQKMRQKQQDLEIKHAHEERMREKAAEAAAREKVRQQIAQDKLERKQKELALQQEIQKQQNPEQLKPHMPVPSDATVTRIQFRLPSGNPHMGQFEPTSTLGALRSYVVQNIDLPFRQFAMSTTFPRRDLTHEDDNKTLLELELVPTAVILILPLKNSTVTTTVTSTQDIGFLSRFVWSLFAPLIGAYNYIVSYFSRDTRRNTEERQADTGGGAVEPANSADGAVLPNLQNIANSGLLRRYLSNQGGTRIRAEGNIHRLHSGGDDNDENNTWNGNSTQQM